MHHQPLPLSQCAGLLGVALSQLPPLPRRSSMVALSTLPCHLLLETSTARAQLPMQTGAAGSLLLPAL